MAILTNPKPTMYRNLYKDTGPGDSGHNAPYESHTKDFGSISVIS